MAKKKGEKLTLTLSVVLPNMTAEGRWKFIQWIQNDFKGYCENIGDTRLNFTPNEFWRHVQKFDVKVTGTFKPVETEPEVEEPEEE